jgi:hypothetical protein
LSACSAVPGRVPQVRARCEGACASAQRQPGAPRRLLSLKLKVDRSALEEDPDAGNADELKAKIRIHAPETPVEFTDDSFTDQEVLLG